MCRRQYCPDCGEELIHRDHRKGWESSSSFGAIIRRIGPSEITVGDIDCYLDKCEDNVLRIIEHKQTDARLGRQQEIALRKIDQCVRAAIAQCVLDPRSGVFLIRGCLHGSNHGQREVDFAGRQIVYSLDGEIILSPKTRQELWDWVNCGRLWTPRRGQSRVEFL
jgi:hypothetical protein